MLSLGLTSEEQRAFHATLRTHHRIYIRLQLLDLDHRYLGDLSRMFQDGQVDMVASGEVATRTLTLSLLDPRRRSGLDGAGPEDAPLAADRMIRVYYCVLVPVLDRWVDVPVFTGPVTAAKREGYIINITATGKEILAQSPGWRIRTWARGLRRVHVLRSVLEELAGETRFSLPYAWPARLPKALALKKTSQPWAHAKILARSMAAQLFYDGRGRTRLRRGSDRPVWWFRDGEGGDVAEAPQLTFEDKDIVNTAHVIGGTPVVKKPKGKKAPATKGKKPATLPKIEETAYLPATDPHSPSNLGRGSRGRYRVETIENDQIRTRAEAREVAKSILAKARLERVQVQFTGLVVPHLEELDAISVDAGDVHSRHHLTSMSLPLTAGVATYGYTANVMRRRRTPRAKKRVTK